MLAICQIQLLMCRDLLAVRAGPDRSSGADYDTPEPAWRKMTTITRFGPFGSTSACAVRPAVVKAEACRVAKYRVLPCKEAQLA